MQGEHDFPDTGERAVVRIQKRGGAAPVRHGYVPVQCFAYNEDNTRCRAASLREAAGQHYCDRHFAVIRQAVLALRDVCVYFAVRDGLVKIGVSHDPNARMDTLGAELVATEAGGRPRESALHSLFAADRITGEWFSPSTDLLTYIARLRPRSKRICPICVEPYINAGAHAEACRGPRTPSAVPLEAVSPTRRTES